MDASRTQSREVQFTCKALDVQLSERSEQGFNDDIVEFPIDISVATDFLFDTDLGFEKLKNYTFPRPLQQEVVWKLRTLLYISYINFSTSELVLN